MLMHSDFIEFEPLTKAIASAEEVVKERRRIEECLVVFSAVEKQDEVDVAQTAANAVSEIIEVAKQLKAQKIVLYPLVHLTSKPSAPSKALEVLRRMEEGLKGEKYDVRRAPFGWYKAFSLRVKGHPLSELSREIAPLPAKRESGEMLTVAGEPISEALRKEGEMKSQFFILTPEGELVEVDKFNFSGPTARLQKFAEYEMRKVRAYEQEPPHIRMMRELKLADFEPGSDPGNLRWYPNGRLVKKLLERHVSERVRDYGGIEVETPVMYDFEHHALKSYLNRFPARQYIVRSEDKDFFLRFSACFGQFLMAKDAVLSYKQLPLRIYELTRYSFRREQSGELAGLRRLRAFTMPDCHALCADIAQAKEEMLVRFDLAMRVQEEIGIGPSEELELVVRFTREFWEQNREFVEGLVKRWGRPALVELWPERIFYFVLKYEFNFIDNLGKASALTTDQIDVENGERYGIQYVDRDGQRRHPVILHLSPTGAIERVVFALLEMQARRIKEGKTPMLPLWLSPTQVRVIPIADRHLDFAKELAEQLELNEIRVDIDDRPDTLQKRVREAEHEWVPFVVVVGDKEKESKRIAVRVRGETAPREMALEELIVQIRSRVKGLPFEKQHLPKLLSKRPIFAG